MDIDRKNSFVTSRGVSLEFVSIAPLLDKLAGWYAEQQPKVPTYTPTAAEGFVAQPEPHYHRVVTVAELDENEQPTGRMVEKVETSLETPEEWAAWNAYEAESRRLTKEFSERLLKTILLRGLKLEMPQDDAWVREQEFMGYTVPQDPLERKMYWLETELFSTKAEIQEVVVQVVQASGTNEEVISAMERSFRGDVERNAAR